MELRMSWKERDRLGVLRQVEEGKMKQAEAAEVLRVSPRQLRRLLRRYGREGDAGLVHRLRGRASNRRVPAEIQERAVALVKEKYGDYGPTQASEVLAEEQGIAVSRETLRKWMTQAGLWQSRRARVQHRQWRERRACVGELVQMDTSIHDWLEGRGEKCVLIAMIDDASSRLLARFYPSEGTEANMRALHDYMRRYGRPVALYTDRAGHFVVNRPPDLEEQLAGREPESQIGRALRELGIELILASSPQAKGRVERLFRTLQDRLIKALRRKGIGTLAEANEYLEKEFLPMWQERFAVLPKSKANAHRAHKGFDLDAILSVQETRVVAPDYTLQYHNQRFQIEKRSIGAGLRGSKVIVEQRLNGMLRIRWKGEYLHHHKIGPRPTAGGDPPCVTPVGLRPPSVTHGGHKRKPKPDHPWYRGGHF